VQCTHQAQESGNDQSNGRLQAGCDLSGDTYTLSRKYQWSSQVAWSLLLHQSMSRNADTPSHTTSRSAPCTLVERHSRETSNACAHIAANNTSTASHRMPRKPRITLTVLPTDVLSCIAHHLRQNVGHAAGRDLRRHCSSAQRVPLTAPGSGSHRDTCQLPPSCGCRGAAQCHASLCR
jgi:hypothetical protein